METELIRFSTEPNESKVLLKCEEGTYFAEPPQIRGNENTISIGKYCSIARNVVFDSGFNHNTSFVSTFPFHNLMGIGKPNVVCKGDIIIGNDVWICENVLVMSGVTIGNGSVIGANSIVTRDVAPYSIIAGSPARIIKMRFVQEHIKALEKICWWNWDGEKILKELPFADNIEDFIKKHL